MKFFDYINADEIEGFEAPVEMARRVYPVGTKFNICADKDPWYIVEYVDDAVKFKNNMVAPLVVYKSWNKYKQSWLYKVEDCRLLLMEQDFLAREDDGRIIPLKKDEEYKKILASKKRIKNKK